MSATRLPQSEKQFQKAVLEYARARGWLCAHFTPAQVKGGRWVTPMQGDSGYPDLTLARGGRLLFCELKQDGKKPSPEQKEWLDELRAVSLREDELCGQTCVDVWVWTPADWSHIERALR